MARVTARAWPTLLTGLVLVCGALAPSAACAQPAAQAFEQAREAYGRGEYAMVVDLLEPMVGGPLPAIQDRVLIRESRRYLGAAYVLTGRNPRADEQFEALLRSLGDDMERYQLDAADFPSEVHAVFRDVRERLLEERRDRETAEARADAARSRARREALLALLTLAEEDEVEIVHDPALAWVPFGAGQFQNGNADLGAFFLVTESITLLGAVGSFAAWVPLQDQGTVDLGILRALQVANWVSVGALGVLALAGVIEAHINFVPSHRERRRREVPENILEHLDLSVGPGTLGLRLRF